LTSLNRLPRPPDCQATGKNGDGTALKRGKVSVDASRKSRSDDEAFEPELGGKLACEFLPTADRCRRRHGDDGTRRGLEPALGIKKWRRRIDIGQCRGIASLAHGNEMSAGAIGCFKLGFGLSLGEDADRSAAAVTAPAVQRALPRRHQTD
jgi:hypothetical protein